MQKTTTFFVVLLSVVAIVASSFNSEVDADQNKRTSKQHSAHQRSGKSSSRVAKKSSNSESVRNGTGSKAGGPAKPTDHFRARSQIGEGKGIAINGLQRRNQTSSNSASVMMSRAGATGNSVLPVSENLGRPAGNGISIYPINDEPSIRSPLASQNAIAVPSLTGHNKEGAYFKSNHSSEFFGLYGRRIRK